MERLFAATAGRALEDARAQAEIVLAALRGDATDGDFLLVHAEQLLAYCREIADSRLVAARG